MRVAQSLQAFIEHKGGVLCDEYKIIHSKFLCLHSSAFCVWR